MQILANKELVAISQDPLGVQGRLVASAAAASGYTLPPLTAAQRARMPQPASAAAHARYRAALADTFGGVTDCTLDAAAVGAAQQWRLPDGTIRQGGLCLGLSAAGGSEVSASPCDGSAAQRWQGLANVSVTVAPIMMAPAAPLRDWFDGPATGVAQPSETARRCGTCCGASDTSSPMCRNTTSDGKLFLGDAEIRARCLADAKCAGFDQDTTEGGYYRPMSTIDGVNAHDAKWRTWRKRAGPQPPPPPPAPRCLATDGGQLVVEACVEEPAECASTRCASSARVRQLWFFARSGQLLSSFTDAPVPPAATAPPPPPPSRTSVRAREAGLFNVPKCIATAPNPDPPRPPQPPPDVDSKLPLQTWAGALSRGRVAVILVNAAPAPATVTAHWSTIGLRNGTTVAVRDAIAHTSNGTAAGPSLAVRVESHDVAVLVLEPTHEGGGGVSA